MALTVPSSRADWNAEDHSTPPLPASSNQATRMPGLPRGLAGQGVLPCLDPTHRVSRVPAPRALRRAGVGSFSRPVTSGRLCSGQGDTSSILDLTRVHTLPFMLAGYSRAAILYKSSISPAAAFLSPGTIILQIQIL